MAEWIRLFEASSREQNLRTSAGYMSALQATLELEKRSPTMEKASPKLESATTLDLRCISTNDQE